MSPRPSTSRDTVANSTHPRPGRPPGDRNNPLPNLDRPLPPLPSNPLPPSYEIPALRQTPYPKSGDVPPAEHGRSASRPFLRLFGRRRSAKRQQDDDFVSSDAGPSAKIGIGRANSGQNGRMPPAPQPDRQSVTGECMACDVTIRWPRDLKVVRCITCLTINDLEPFDEDQLVDGSAESLPTRTPMAISLDRTREMIDHCLSEYFDHILKTDSPLVQSSGAEEASLQHSNPVGYGLHGALTEPHRPSDTISGQSVPTSDNTVQSSHLQTLFQQQSSNTYRERSALGLQAKDKTPLAPESQIQDHPSAIFRTVEIYIANHFKGCTSLNLSFSTVQPVGQSDEREELALGRNPPGAVITPKSETDNCFPELDAKTLLLGDIAENASWWTGAGFHWQNMAEESREKFPDSPRGNVSAESPHIDWRELGEWYRLLIHAGQDWRKRWNSIKPSHSEVSHSRWQSVSTTRLLSDITDSQIHLQRSLLKSTENLLKRPRRPLKNPEDCRFLLMLLANPLLYPSSRNSRTASAGFGRMDRPRHHFGIIERVLGLMANVPSDTHQYLMSWMSTFSDVHFQALVDVVGAFVTHRLGRRQGQVVNEPINAPANLIPTFGDSGASRASELYAALVVDHSGSSRKSKQDGNPKLDFYSEDWQIKAAARVMSLLFNVNSGHLSRRRTRAVSEAQHLQSAGPNAKHQAYSHGQIVPISAFYSIMLDHADLVADFKAWESTKSQFTFCQYPFFLSIWAKIQIFKHEARRQMDLLAREAMFLVMFREKAVNQFLFLKVRRECLVEDSLKSVSEVIGSGSEDIKKGLRINFVGEEGIDGGGLRKEWFLLLVREIFDPLRGLFVYDEESRYCYFNPACFESSEQFFLVGVLLGLAVYNSIILDVAFPPFVFKRLLASAPPTSEKATSVPKARMTYTLEDLAELRPSLAQGLRQFLEYDGDVRTTFCHDFVIDTERYGEIIQVQLCHNGHKRAVTNSNRHEFVDLYIRYLLDTAVVRQYEPFKRGFFKACGSSALSLFHPEEIELLVRGADEQLDVANLRLVATYEDWPSHRGPPHEQAQVVWFWECFEHAHPTDQRKLLGFITGSDRIPATGAIHLVITVQLLRDVEAEERGIESQRFPVARTCFNTIGLYLYHTKTTLENKLWAAVHGSQGFGLK